MVPTAIISDIHSNSHALTAVLAEADRLGCRRFFCLGDLVGYGADPNACVDRLRRPDVQCVMGNHDALVAGLERGDAFNPFSLQAAEANRTALSDENLEFLYRLPRTLQAGPQVLLCHGTPYSWNRYLLHAADLEAAAGDGARAEQTLIFFGHTHHPVFFDGTQRRDLYKAPHALPASITLVNPGSVGQPRDGDPRAAFAVWDPAERTLAFQRVDYDVEAARQAILDAGLPEYLGDRLRAGR